MNPIFGLGQQMTTTPGPFGQNSQVVIPQITIPNGVQKYEPLVANGKDAAKNIYTPPNTKVPIFDSEDSIFYYKETDQYGNIVSFETYTYSKVEEPPPPQYVTVDAFGELVNEVRSLREDIANGSQSVRRQDKQHSNKQWNGNRSGERPDFTDKIANDDGAGQ